MADYLVGILLFRECMACKKIDSIGRESEAECILQEEVVELVRTDEVFGLLFDVSVAVGRD